MAQAADAGGDARARRQPGPRGDPLPRGARARPRSGRHHRQAQTGAEDGVSRRRCLGAARSDRRRIAARGMRRTRSALPSPGAGRSDTCTSPRIVAAPGRATTPRVHSRSSPARRPMRRLRRRSAIPFMFQEFYADRSPEQIASIFGSAFAAAVGQVRPGSWQGPRRVGPGLASGVRDIGDARPRALLTTRSKRTSRPDGSMSSGPNRAAARSRR